MTLPIYSKPAWSMFIAFVLVAAPCAAHKLDSKHLDTSTRSAHLDSTEALSLHYTRRYLLSGDDDALNDFEKHLNENNLNTTSYLLAQAWIAQARHQFDYSLEILNKVTEHEPQNGQAWLTKAGVLTVQGHTKKAKHACNKALRYLSLTAGLLCKARLTQDSDDKNKAYNAIVLTMQHHIPEDLKSWAHSVAAELAADLDLNTQAEMHFKASLNYFAAIQVRARYMDFLIEQKRYREALRISNKSSNPALHIRELISRKRLDSGGQMYLNRAIAHTHHQFMRWQQQEDYQHAREMAMFYLDVMENPELALTFAEINLQNQREQEDHMLVQRAQQMKKIKMGQHRDS